MPCYRPLDAWVRPGKTENGKKDIVFQKPQLYMERIQLPCGQCIGCKLLRSIAWASRCMNEMQQHDESCFITLTYDDEHLPYNLSLPSVDERKEGKADFQKFFRDLRYAISPAKIKYFLCGEYGDESWRPHYHAIIFGYAFPDRVQVQAQDVSNPYFISPTLSGLWPYGYHIIAEANFDTAAYVARYCTKKITGDKADGHYHRTILDWNEFTGEIFEYRETQLEPEFATMSRRPAIGKEWFSRWKNDLYPSDFLIVDGRKVPVPRYYDKLLEMEDEYKLQQQKAVRKIKAMENSAETTLARLRTREECKEAQAKTLRRDRI